MHIDLEEVPNADEATAEAYLRDGNAAAAAEIRILNWDLVDEPFRVTVESWIAALGRLGPLSLERFVVDTYFQPLTRQASVHCGDLTPILRASPHLALAYVIGTSSIDALAHGQLRDLTLLCEPLTPETATAIVRGPCAGLERLDLGFAYERSPDPAAQEAFVAALGEHGLPALRTLSLGWPDDGAGLLDAVARSPILKQLKTLAIIGDVFSDEDRGMAVLREHRAAMSGLERLYLPCEDVMDMTDDQLAELIPGIRGIDEWDAFGPSRYGGA